MRKILLLTVFAMGMSFSIGCDKGFEELNTNPNDPITVPSGLLIADVVFNAGNSLYSTFVGGDMGSCWAQHWGKVQYNDEERYVPRESVIETLIWKTYYEDVISDARSMQLIAETEENKNMQGVGIVMQAYGYSVLTDMFGNIPFTDAIKASDGNFTPAYDSQERTIVCRWRHYQSYFRHSVWRRLEQMGKICQFAQIPLPDAHFGQTRCRQ